MAEPATEHWLRLIGIDRPGMGLSQYQPQRRMRDWPHDVAEFADRLGIDSFAVGGFSGGGPYALACADAIPERLTACGIIAGVGPTSRATAFLALWLPWLLTPLARRRFRGHDHASRSLTRFARGWVEPDRATLDKPGVRATIIASLTERSARAIESRLRRHAVGRSTLGNPLHQLTFAPVMLWDSDAC